MAQFIGIYIISSVIAVLIYGGFFKTHTLEKKNNYLKDTNFNLVQEEINSNL